MFKWSKIIFIALVFQLGLMSCNSTHKNQLINTWHNIKNNKSDSAMFIKFSENKTFSAKLPFYNELINGSYTNNDQEINLSFITNVEKLKIESLTMNIDNGNASLQLKDSIQERATLNQDGTLTAVPKTIKLNYSISNNALNLKYENTSWQFAIKQNHFLTRSFKLESIFRGLLSLLVLIGICYLLSIHKSKISWKLVMIGLLLQLIFAFLVFQVPFVKHIFEKLADFFVVVLDFTKAGSNFLFSGLLDTKNVGFLFAFQVLPTIIFFSALTSLLYYFGILQKIVWGIAWVMSKTMKLSGAESLSTAANIFLGQTEAPLLVKPFIHKMTKSEMLCIMIGGMANIAGGVLAAFVGFLGGDDPEQQRIFATHLLTASILSAPATILISKILIPETEPVEEKLEISKDKLGSNFLEAITNGTTDGVKLAVNVGAMLLVFTALVAMTNYILNHWIGDTTGLNHYLASIGKKDGLTLQLILGYIFAPLACLIGIPWEDILIGGQLLGEKTVLNEFIAYGSLGTYKNAGVIQNPKTILILTYALCGFANFASIGIQIGGISTMAPNKKAMLSKLGFKALIGGTIATMMTASIAGMFY